MKTRLLSTGVIVMLLSTAILSCSKMSSNVNNTGGGGGTTATTVTIANFAFSPASITVTGGSMVKWVNNDNVTHTATSNDGTSFNTGNIAAGASATITVPTKAGTYAYHCTIHTNMTGTLIVSP